MNLVCHGTTLQGAILSSQAVRQSHRTNGFTRGNQAGRQNLPPCPYASFALRQPAIFFDGYLGSSQIAAKHIW